MIFSCIASRLGAWHSSRGWSVPDLTPKPRRLSVPFSYFFTRRKYNEWKKQTWKREQLLSPVQWSTQKYNFRELNREIRLENEKKKAYGQRLWMGTFGGITLIGPVLLMVLHRDLNTSIITACVATTLFTLILAFAGRDLAGKDVLGAAAAYAAVLVIFVGTSMSSTDSGT